MEVNLKQTEKKPRKSRAKKVVMAVNSETKEEAKINAGDSFENVEPGEKEKEKEEEGTIIKESATPAPPSNKKKTVAKKKITLKLEE